MQMLTVGWQFLRKLMKQAGPYLLIELLLPGGTLFALEQTILGEWNRKADSIKAVMNGVAPATLDMLTRQWVVGSHGNIYHYNYFDPGNKVLLGL